MVDKFEVMAYANGHTYGDRLEVELTMDGWTVCMDHGSDVRPGWRKDLEDGWIEAGLVLVLVLVEAGLDGYDEELRVG